MCFIMTGVQKFLEVPIKKIIKSISARIVPPDKTLTVLFET